jgi:hypothetical protein
VEEILCWTERLQRMNRGTFLIVYKFLFQFGGRTHIFWLDKL